MTLNRVEVQLPGSLTTGSWHISSDVLSTSVSSMKLSCWISSSISASEKSASSSISGGPVVSRLSLKLVRSLPGPAGSWQAAGPYFACFCSAQIAMFTYLAELDTIPKWNSRHELNGSLIKLVSLTAPRCTNQERLLWSPWKPINCNMTGCVDPLLVEMWHYRQHKIYHTHARTHTHLSPFLFFNHIFGNFKLKCWNNRHWVLSCKTWTMEMCYSECT